VARLSLSPPDLESEPGSLAASSLVSPPTAAAFPLERLHVPPPPPRRAPCRPAAFPPQSRPHWGPHDPT